MIRWVKSLVGVLTTEFESPYFAAVDLGSNSFHMIIARINQDTLETVDKVKEMVQIARGMNNQELSNEAQERALECLKRFAERVRDIPPSQVRAVGTKTMRSAKNAHSFLNRAEAALGHPIAIISGYEEARLVYSGLTHGVANDNNRRLVIDIGGGSTEFIIGYDDEPELLESLSLGCVVFTEQFLQEKVNRNGMYAAYMAACSELETIRPQYLKRGWDMVYGTSGTMRAVADLLTTEDGGSLIRRDSLTSLYHALVENPEKTLGSQPKLRRDVLPAGIAIISAIFDQLKLDKIHIADATLKDGLIYDTVGRLSNVDSRHSAVNKLQNQYHIDTQQADRVANAAVSFWRTVQAPPLPGVSRTKILRWAAKLHEVGLGISHSGHHHHGYYILKHSDLAGFGRYEQTILATLVRAHRKKLNSDRFTGLEDDASQAILPIVLCLRIAVILHRRREDMEKLPSLSGGPQEYELMFEKSWLENNPLSAQSLESEINNLKNVGIKLTITEN